MKGTNLDTVTKSFDLPGYNLQNSAKLIVVFAGQKRRVNHAAIASHDGVDTPDELVATAVADDFSDLEAAVSRKDRKLFAEPLMLKVQHVVLVLEA